MDTTNIPSTVTEIKNTFLTKKENARGNVALGLIVLAILWGLSKALPFISGLMSSAIGILGKGMVLAGMGGVIFLTVITVTHPSFRNWLWYKRANFYRMLNQRLVKADPIGTAYSYIEEFLRVKYTEVRSAYDVIMGNRQELLDIIERKTEERDKAKEMAETLVSRSCKKGQWTNKDDYMQFRIQSQNVGFLTKVIQNAEKRVKFVEKYAEFHEKIARALDFKIKTLENFLEMLVTDFRTSEVMAKTAQITRETLGEEGKKVEVFNMAVGYVRDKTAESIGQVEALMRMAPSYLMETELQGDIFEDKLMKQLSQLENVDKSADTFLSSAQEEQTKLITSGKPIELLTMAKKEEAVPVRKYSLFDRQDRQ